MMGIAPTGRDTGRMVPAMGIALQGCDASHSVYGGYYMSIAF